MKDFMDILPKDYTIEFRVETVGQSLREPVYVLYGPDGLVFSCLEFEVFSEVFFKYFA